MSESDPTNKSSLPEPVPPVGGGFRRARLLGNAEKWAKVLPDARFKSEQEVHGHPRVVASVTRSQPTSQEIEVWELQTGTDISKYTFMKFEDGEVSAFQQNYPGVFGGTELPFETTPDQEPRPVRAGDIVRLVKLVSETPQLPAID